jgi:pimeloyl-ACP methyl ester carboxylesterase
MGQRTFERIYRGVPREQVERLLSFRTAHPATRLTVAGHEWRYIACGQGDRTILLPPGGERVGDFGFPLVLTLEQELRVLYPSYPPVPTMQELVDGLRAILDAEGVARTHLLGASFGGDVAQCFVRRFPQRVEKLILQSTGVPQPALTRPVRVALRLLAPLPWIALRSVARRFLSQAVSALEGEQAFWKAYLDELVSCQLTKADLLSTLRGQIDYRERYCFTPEDLRDWPGQILILESDDDPEIRPAMRQALRATYPQAQMHVFCAAGHTPSLSQPENYYAVVKEFFL